ncbi:cobyrinic acid a,c-diamide synthase [Desulfolithobacter dissulfuricans]|uniref:Cobyrinic acid a,c-diamide synthase n=1 Tax=Desulfolithobacter dissulfuricans TaxID=2795293 RepID=A0A915TYY9_9BACT|nr:ATP-binding protein [Desulfolithobacter dissulfuricans]BCO08401.1 cobyrinic acid a,c-diamide synthase [Desulfolithobacter dissulfuricans]
MREILIISGKGGTGKTSLTAAFSHLADNKIICDLDVDAPDLHLLLQPCHEQEVAFYAGNEARINQDGCTGCGTCAQMCRYNAIRQENDRFTVDPIRCEGCKVCVSFCPEQTIEFPEKHCGTWYVSTTRFGTMVHAQLFPGEENSGRLVALLKNEAKKLARENNIDLILSDGAPGIGCPVISSLSGANFAVLVTEPTPSGRHDLERVASLCDHFRIRSGVIINKADLNPDEAAMIEQYCRERNYPLLARLPHDPVITEAMVQERAVTELGETEIGREIRQAWTRIEELAG